MAQGIWEDFTEKFGFGDGASTEDRDFRARDILIRTLNQQPEMKAAGVRTVAYDRPGVHNGCMILVGKNIEGMPDDKFLEAVLETDEVELPEMAAEIAELIAEAYAEADQPAPPSGRNRGDQATSLYHVLHTHGEGTTPYLVRAAEEPTQERLIEALGIDFAPEREEFIEVYPVDFNKPFDLDGPATTPQPCGHVPADPNAEQTPCELCGQTVAPDPDEPHLWRTLVYLAAARDPRIPVHERDNPPSEEVLKARSTPVPEWSRLANPHPPVRSAPDLDDDPELAARVKAADDTASIAKDEDYWWVGTTRVGRTDFCPTPAAAWKECAILLGLEPGTVRSIDALKGEE